MSLVDLGKRLLEAAKTGRDEEVRTLMSNGAPFTTDWLGTSPLHMAAQMGHLSTAEVLLRAGVSRDARTKVDRTPLHMAAQEGHVQLVELLMKHGADINAKDMLQMTPLHWAVEREHQDVVQSLLKNGADAAYANKFDKTALEIAMDKDNQDMMHLLQEAQLGLMNGTSQTITSDLSTSEAVETLTTSASNIQTLVTAAAAVKSASHLTPTTTGDTNQQQMTSSSSSTSVLATLAALAEASAPLNTPTTSTQETLSWLEAQTVTVDSGQTLTLTEAGKLALNWSKNPNTANSGGSGDSQENTSVDSAIEQVVGSEDSSSQRVITIVTDQSHEDIPVSQLSSIQTPTGTTTSAPLMVAMANDTPNTVTIVTQDVPVSEDGDNSDSSAAKDLEKQLQEAQKQAEKYKQQLEQKQLEAETYKQKLEQISNQHSPSSSTSDL
ncbi:uncharacterized protein LOC144450195 [Glandiceps talaboti]